jgi:hypothetical protein
MEYDSTLMSYTSHLVNPQLDGMFVNVNRVSPTSRFYKVLVVWTNPLPQTLPNESALLTLTFTYLTGNDSIRFNNTVGGGSFCEYADENQNPMNDIPTSAFYHNGSITNAGPGAAGVITGTAVLCQGVSGIAYSVPPVTNATGYLWALPSGATIASGENTNSITVNFSPDASSGILSVSGVNSCGSGQPSDPFPVTVNPLPNATISGSETICAGSSTIIQVDLTGSPPWNITYTDGLTPVNIDGISSSPFSFTVTPDLTTTYWITYVSDGNSCSNTGSGNEVITVNPLPTATISGSETICNGSSGFIQVDLTGASPWNITYTDGSTPVNIDGISSSPFSFTVTPDLTTTYWITYVSDGNSCSNTGSGSVVITVNPIPDPPLVTADSNLLTSSSPLGNQWYYEGTGPIPGATGQTYTVTSNTGYYWCTVTLDDCTSPASNWEWVVVTGIPESQKNNGFNVFPVPNDGKFKVTISNIPDDTFTIAIYNQLGSEIYKLNDIRLTNGKTGIEIDLGPVSNGVYTVVLRNFDRRIVRKILITR